MGNVHASTNIGWPNQRKWDGRACSTHGRDTNWIYVG